MTNPPNAEHVDALDGWRGMAISALLIGHFAPIPGINIGGLGVSLFFVLSGMLMARLLFIKEVPLPLFYKRRISRIVPAHLSFIALCSGASALLGLPVLLNEIIPATFFFNNYVRTTVMPFGHIWSLSVEEHSYIALSLLTLLPKRLLRWALGMLVAGCAAMSCWYFFTQTSDRALYDAIIRTEVAGYGIAVSAALCWYFSRRGVPRTPALLVPLLLCSGVALHWWKVPQPLSQIAGVGMFALAVNLLPASAAVVQRLFSLAWLRQLGIWSFSIYLWQQPFCVAYLDHGLSLPFALLGTALMAGASYYLIERPTRRYLNARWAANAPAIAQARPT